VALLGRVEVEASIPFSVAAFLALGSDSSVSSSVAPRIRFPPRVLPSPEPLVSSFSDSFVSSSVAFPAVL